MASEIAELRAALRNSELVRAATYEHALALEHALEQSQIQLSGARAELIRLREANAEALLTIEELHDSASWRIGQSVVAPVRWARKVIG